MKVQFYIGNQQSDKAVKEGKVMLEKKRWLLGEEFEELSNFLGGYFHQDMGPLEEVWEEIIEDSNKSNTVPLINEIERFFNSNLSDEEKEEFIEDNCDLYFPAINSTPLEWLRQVQVNLKNILISLEN